MQSHELGRRSVSLNLLYSSWILNQFLTDLNQLTLLRSRCLLKRLLPHAMRSWSLNPTDDYNLTGNVIAKVALGHAKEETAKLRNDIVKIRSLISNELFPITTNICSCGLHLHLSSIPGFTSRDLQQLLYLCFGRNVSLKQLSISRKGGFCHQSSRRNSNYEITNERQQKYWWPPGKWATRCLLWSDSM